MMQKNIIIALVAALAVGAALYLAPQRTSAPDMSESGLVVGKNAIYVSNQPPADRISVGVALFETPGFVVIHEAVDEKPGAILGVSGQVPAGEAQDIPPIELLRETRNGETLFAMLHTDDGDGVFEPASDMPVMESGEPVMMEFVIDSEADGAGAVNL